MTWTLWIFVGLIVLGITGVGGFYAAVLHGKFGPLPQKEELGNIVNAQASEIYFADQSLMGKYYLQNRSNVRLEDISQGLIDALIATEDVRFYEHEGVDWKSLRRVLVKSILLQNKSSGGGSTITQQLAKNLFPRQHHGLFTMPVNKVKEMIVAGRLEEVYTKDEILELYLNTVSFGENIFGIGVATNRFFNQSPRKIPLEQSAVLVGMLKANTRYNPIRNPSLATSRRNVVLDQMVKYEYLEAAVADSLKTLDLLTDYQKISILDAPAPYFRQQVAEELQAWFEANPGPDGKIYNLYTDGLRIHTTLDAGMQRIAVKAVQNHLKKLQATFDEHWKGRNLWDLSDPGIQRAMKQSDRYKSLKARGKSAADIRKIFETNVPMTIWTWEGEQERDDMSPFDSLVYYNSFLHAGFMAMEPKTGYVRAWVGGINFRQFKYDHVTSQRQVGSTFKPIVYAAALAHDSLSPCDYIANQQQVYSEYKNWSPGNSGGKYEGFYSLTGGLTHSVNTVSAEVMMRVGVDQAVSFAQGFGFEQRLPREPSLVLGTADLSIKEMVGAYSAFANRGERAIPIYIARIEDHDGNTIVEFPTKHAVQRVMEPIHADMMAYMLRSVVDSGTASRLRRVYGIPRSIQVGGKTGTTQNQTDGWFMGITPGLVAGAWVGGEDRQVRFRSLRLGQGANTALPIYASFLKELSKKRSYRGYYGGSFQEPGVSAMQSLDCPMYTLYDYQEADKIQLEDVWDRIRQNWEDKREARQAEGKRVIFPPRRRPSKTIPDRVPPRQERSKPPSSRNKKRIPERVKRKKRRKSKVLK
ncbi:MAG: transglycosylase domain-containing protein [Bacteroidota bacterium]